MQSVPHLRKMIQLNTILKTKKKQHTKEAEFQKMLLNSKTEIPL